ncbi:MAG TPA: tRNA lysidine(34) synthetase TilS [Elusimicrobiales bacterium]|nr:tRNA lysidine(34) synthetase TilS [Elusimicrobiales bacterium]
MDKKAFYGRLWNKLISFIRQYKLVNPTDKILVAVSGGTDSVCLLDFLVKLSNKKSIEIVACHVNHSIRGKDSDTDEKFTENLCKKLGITFISKKVDTYKFAREKRLSVEHAARTLRYRVLNQAAQKYDCNKVATAHHLDDHIETFMLNLLRSTSLKGLTGMPLKRKIAPKSKITIIRPLFCLTRKEIEGYLKYNKLKYRKDKTNKSLKFTRNWIRLELIPMIEKKQPQFKKHIFEISEKLSDVLNV